MKEYVVDIAEVYHKSFVVSASNQDEARQLAKQIRNLANKANLNNHIETEYVYDLPEDQWPVGIAKE